MTNGFSVHMVTQDSKPSTPQHPKPSPHVGKVARNGDGGETGFESDLEAGISRELPITKRSSRGKRYKPKGNCLKIRCHFEDEQGGVREIVALVDTGAEINLVGSSLLPRQVTHTVYPPLSFTTGNKGSLSGGDREASGLIHFQGRDPESNMKQQLTCPIHFCEADIPSMQFFHMPGWRRVIFVLTPGGTGCCLRMRRGRFGSKG